MKVRILVAMAGAGFARVPGDVVEVDAPEAGRLIAARYAEAVAPVRQAPREVAVSRPALRRERAVAQPSAADLDRVAADQSAADATKS